MEPANKPRNANQQAYNLLLNLLDQSSLSRRGFLARLIAQNEQFDYSETAIANWGRPGRAFPNRPGLVTTIVRVLMEQSEQKCCTAEQIAKLVTLIDPPLSEVIAISSLFKPGEFGDALRGIMVDFPTDTANVKLVTVEKPVAIPVEIDEELEYLPTKQAFVELPFIEIFQESHLQQGKQPKGPWWREKQKQVVILLFLTFLLLPMVTISSSRLPKNTLDATNVFANQGWQPTGIYVATGDWVEVDYVSGTWTTSRNTDPFVGPKGYEGKRYDWAVNKKADLGALIATIGGYQIDVGQVMKFRVPADGILELRMNDGNCEDKCISDNAGSILFSITVKAGE